MNYSFWGNTLFSLMVLEDLAKHNFLPKVVVTFSPKTFGRQQIKKANPVETFARQKNLKIIYSDHLLSENFLNELKKSDCQVGVVASFGKIIPKNVLKLFKNGLTNIHPSLLPKYRGPSPIQSAILNNEIETGTSLFILDEHMDHGPIIGQMSASLEIEDDYLSLSKKLACLGSKLTLNLLPKYLNQETFIKPQEESLATYTNKFVFENCQINWNDTVTKVYNFIRALSFEPGVFTTFKKNEKTFLLKILKVKPILENQLYNELYKNYSTVSASHIVNYEKRFFIKTFDSFLELSEVQPSGKNPMSFSSFFNGHQIKKFE